MFTADNVEVFDKPLPKTRRPGAGRPAGGSRERSTDELNFDAARARNEASKANLNELEFKVKSGEYIDREVVKQVSSQAAASIAQTLRSIPDNLERKGIDPKVCLQIGEVIDEALNELADEFAMMTPEAAQ